MADVAEIFLPPLQGEEEIYETLAETAPYWSASAFDGEIDHHHYHHGNDYGALDPDIFVPIFPPSDTLSFRRRSPQMSLDSDYESNYLGNPVSLVLDLFDRCSPQPHHRDGGRGDATEVDPFTEALDPFWLGVYDGGEETISDYLGLDLGLGLGLGIEEQQDDEDGGVGDNSEEGSDWGRDGFFFGQQSGVVSESAGADQSRSLDGEGLRIVGFESDEQIKRMGPHSNVVDAQDQITGDRGLPLRWDWLYIAEDGGSINGEFELEEVDGRVDVWELLRVGIDADRSIVREEAHVDVEAREEEDHDSSINGNPLAAKSVFENLPSVVLTQEDEAKNNTLCAVCKDEISLEERAKQLPCSHHYHEECILQWLGIRNTCPVCRYELPTDDPGYGSWRSQRAGRVGALHEVQVRNDFEMLPED